MAGVYARTFDDGTRLRLDMNEETIHTVYYDNESFTMPIATIKRIVKQDHKPSFLHRAPRYVVRVEFTRQVNRWGPSWHTAAEYTLADAADRDQLYERLMDACRIVG